MKPIEDFYQGKLSILDAVVELRGIKATLEDQLKEIKDFEVENLEQIATEADAYNNSYKGFNIKMVKGRKTFDYSNISEIRDLKNRLRSLEGYYKQAYESRLKGIKIASEDGEEIDMPNVKYTKSYIVVK